MNIFDPIESKEIKISFKAGDIHGLSSSEASAVLEKYGPNKIEKEEKNPWWKILLGQLKSPIVYLLLFAASMSFYFNEWMDGVAILVVIIINTIIGFYMEYQASRSMAALQNLALVPAKVLRDGKLVEINAEDIVPGDTIYLEAGDLVSADGKILHLSRLQVNESALTGESVPVEKSIHAEPNAKTLADQKDHLFKGTFITNGNVYATVTETGMRTELGKIAMMVQNAEQAATPLEKKLETFSQKLIQITILLVVVIFISGWWAGHGLIEMMNTSIALAVAAIPEGLPIVATLALARGMLKMAKHNVIVKKLSAVETLGGTSIICTDKTGTLTENKMTVKEVIPVIETSKEITEQILHASILCNTASIDDMGKELGDPLEIALLNYASKTISPSAVRRVYPKVDEEPFSSETKRMLTLHQSEKSFFTFAKGAVESVLSITSLTDELKETILKQSEKLASSGHKVIGFASREDHYNKLATSGLNYLGMIGLTDPPRQDVAQAIAECKDAGIKVIMITGDHPQTAKEIGSQLGMESTAHVMVGTEMKSYAELDEHEKKTWLNTSIFARVTPAQKLDLIKLYQEKKFIVGMTGDGVNDAPALKKADIGIAMGMRGTQVAQDVADMVIKDDSFSSIVTAIKQGRVIFDNIRKFVIYLLSCNLSELLTIAVTAILNLHFQLFPLQILFINLITDVLPALALGVTPGNDNIMKTLPRKSDEPIITNTQWRTIIFYAIVISAASMTSVLTSHYVFHKQEGWNPALCNNILFFTLIGSQLLHVFNMNTSGSNFIHSEIIRNKYIWYAVLICIAILIILYEIPAVRTALSIYTLTFADWSIIIVFSFSGLIVNQSAKRFKIIKH